MSGSSIVSDPGELDGDYECDHGRNYKFDSEWDADVSPDPCDEPAVVEFRGPSSRLGGIRLCETHAEQYREETGA